MKTSKASVARAALGASGRRAPVTRAGSGGPRVPRPAPAGRRWRARRGCRGPAGGSRRRGGPGRRCRAGRSVPSQRESRSASARPMPVPGVCGQAARSARGLPMTWSAGWPNSSLGVVVPGGDERRALSTWTTATLTRSSATGRAPGGSDGPGRAGAGGALGQVELEPDLLVGGGVLDAPAGGERGAQQQAAAAFAVGVPMRPAACPGAELRVRGSGRRPRRGRRARRGGTRTSAAVPACTTALVTSSLVRTTASSTMSVEAPALQGVPDEGAGGGDRPPHRLEGGGCPRGDHRISSYVVSRAPGCCHGRGPLVHRRRTAIAPAGHGRPSGSRHARLLTSTGPADAGRARVSPPRVLCAVRGCCRTVMAWLRPW